MPNVRPRDWPAISKATQKAEPAPELQRRHVMSISERRAQLSGHKRVPKVEKDSESEPPGVQHTARTPEAEATSCMEEVLGGLLPSSALHNPSLSTPSLFGTPDRCRSASDLSAVSSSIVAIHAATEVYVDTEGRLSPKADHPACSSSRSHLVGIPSERPPESKPAWFSDAIEGVKDSLLSQISSLRSTIAEDQKPIMFHHEIQRLESAKVQSIQAEPNDSVEGQSKAMSCTDRQKQCALSTAGEQKSVSPPLTDDLDISNWLSAALRPLEAGIQRLEDLLIKSEIGPASASSVSTPIAVNLSVAREWRQTLDHATPKRRASASNSQGAGTETQLLYDSDSESSIDTGEEKVAHILGKASTYTTEVQTASKKSAGAFAHSHMLSNRGSQGNCIECGSALGYDDITRCPNCDAEIDIELSLWERFLEWLQGTACCHFFREHQVEPDSNSRIYLVVSNRWFEICCSSVIVCNALFIGYSQNYAIANLSHQKSTFITIMELLFATFYAVEISLKVLVHRFYFVFGVDWKWNLFDVGLIVSALWDQVDALNSGALQFGRTSLEPTSRDKKGGSNVVFIRLVRLFKLVKIFRIFRVMKAFRELRVLLFSIVKSIKSLFWVLTLLTLILYIFSLIFVQAATDYLEEEPLAETEALLRERYGSTQITMDTLYQAITGGADWSELARPLRSLPSPDSAMTYYSVFVMYIGFLFFAVLNILTGVFVEKAMKSSRDDSDNMVHEHHNTHMAMHNDMVRLFNILDEDQKGTVNMREFTKFENHPYVTAYFHHMDFDMNDAEDLLETLANATDDGEVCLTDFIQGCKRMKGSAKRCDFVALNIETRRIAKNLDRLKADSKKWSKALRHEGHVVKHLVSKAMEELLVCHGLESRPRAHFNRAGGDVDANVEQQGSHAEVIYAQVMQADGGGRRVSTPSVGSAAV